MRFEVLVNGSPICISGQPGFGVLSVTLPHPDARGAARHGRPSQPRPVGVNVGRRNGSTKHHDVLD